MLSDKELEELLNLASKPLVQKKESKTSMVYSFILDNNIKPGSTQITPAKVYDAFKIWYEGFEDKSSFKELTGEAKFYREFKKYFGFQRRRRTGIVYYLLDSSSFDMSEEAEVELQEHLKNKHGKKK